MLYSYFFKMLKSWGTWAYPDTPTFSLQPSVLQRALFLCFRFFPSALADYIARAALGLHVYLSDVFTYDAEAYKLHTADKADDARHARPARNGLAAQRRDERPKASDKAYQRNDNAEPGDELERLYRKAGDTVDREGDHLLERIVALSGNALGTGVAHRSALEADERYQSAQEEIDLLEVCKLLEDARAYKAVVGVVIDDLRAHHREELIEALRGKALEEGVRLAAGTHTVDYLAAVEVSVDHRVHRVYVVLPVTVNGDRDIALVLRLHKSGKDGILVPAVAALADSDVMLVRLCKPLNDAPCVVLAAVVYEKHAAVGAYLARGGKGLELFEEHRRGDRENLLLIVAGNNDE